MNEHVKYYQDKLNYEIDAADVFDQINTTEDIIIVDTRQTHGYKRQHIPGAINLPHKTMNAESTAHLDKARTYVCYCDGIGCNASTKGAMNMAVLGFKSKELIGGIEWWKFDGYATEGIEKTEGSAFECAC